MRYFFLFSSWVSCWLLTTEVGLADPRITGSAAFDIDSNNQVKGVSVSVAIGQNDAFSRAFFEPNSNSLSAIAIGSQGSINISEESSTGIGQIRDSLSFTQGWESDRGSVPIVIPNRSDNKDTDTFLKTQP